MKAISHTSCLSKRNLSNAETSRDRKTRTQLLRYLLSVAGAIALNYLCMKIFVDALHFWPTPSKLLTTVISALYSYAAARYFTFRS